MSTTEREPLATPPLPEPQGIHYEPRPQPPVDLDATPELAGPGQPRGAPGSALDSGMRLLRRLPCPLCLVLLLQAVLSLRLVWANTAFEDEALYLWAGHLEWAHWLHGTPIPDFATYFSGSPVVYPPLGAVADSVGGLAGARILSLLFLLGATCLLWDVTRARYGGRAALLAAALFAGLASTQFLGAFATYDAMALTLLALATWLVTRANGRFSEPMLALASLAMVTADAAKYAAALWNPVIIALAVLLAQRGGLAQRAFRGARMVIYAALIIVLALRGDSQSYLTGILLTTVARPPGHSNSIGVLYIAAKWVGTVAFAAAIGIAVVFVRHKGWPARLIALALAVAVLLAPADQAHIHTVVSLFKHVDYGAWFAAPVAGYALAALSAAVPPVKQEAALLVGVAAISVSSVLGFPLATRQYHAWPDTKSFIAALEPVLKENQGLVVANEETSVIDYYLSGPSASHPFTSSFYFAFTNPQTHVRLHGDPAYAEAVKDQYFAVIALPFNAELKTDDSIQQAINRYGGYKLVKTLPYHITGLTSSFRIWVREGAR